MGVELIGPGLLDLGFSGPPHSIEKVEVTAVLANTGPAHDRSTLGWKGGILQTCSAGLGPLLKTAKLPKLS